MKKIILILCLLVIPISMAASSINLLTFHYQSGDLTLLDKESAIGYFPDRILDEGITIQIRDNNNQLLYTTQVEIPQYEYTDGHENGNNLGEVIIRDNFNFTVAMPRFLNEKSITILQKNKDPINIQLEEPPIYSPKRTSFWVIILIPILLISIIYILRKLMKGTA